MAALTAAALGVAVRMADATGQGEFRELLVRGVDGYVATYAAGGSAVLTLLAQDRVNVGRFRYPDRRARGGRDGARRTGQPRRQGSRAAGLHADAHPYGARHSPNALDPHPQHPYRVGKLTEKSTATSDRRSGRSRPKSRTDKPKGRTTP